MYSNVLTDLQQNQCRPFVPWWENHLENFDRWLIADSFDSSRHPKWNLVFDEPKQNRRWEWQFVSRAGQYPGISSGRTTSFWKTFFHKRPADSTLRIGHVFRLSTKAKDIPSALPFVKHAVTAFQICSCSSTGLLSSLESISAAVIISRCFYRMCAPLHIEILFSLVCMCGRGKKLIGVSLYQCRSSRWEMARATVWYIHWQRRTIHYTGYFSWIARRSASKGWSPKRRRHMNSIG